MEAASGRDVQEAERFRAKGAQSGTIHRDRTRRGGARRAVRRIDVQTCRVSASSEAGPQKREGKELMPRMSSEFAGFVRDTAVRAFDLLSERVKEVPTALRLFHEPLDDQFDIENRWYRDAGRDLAGYREADAVVTAIKGLSPRVRGQLGFVALRKLRSAAQQRRRAAYRDRKIAEARMASI